MTTMICPHCGKETNKERGVCSYCKEPLHTQLVAETNVSLIGSLFFGICIIAFIACASYAIYNFVDGSYTSEVVAWQFVQYSIFAFLGMTLSYIIKALGVLIEKK